MRRWVRGGEKGSAWEMEAGRMKEVQILLLDDEVVALRRYGGGFKTSQF